MSGTNTTTQLDLKKVKEIIFSDIEKLLDSFGLEYEQVSDNIFMRCPIHEGSDNPQGVSLSLTKQAWRCWTRGCHEEFHTDIFGLVKGVLDTDSFSEVLRYICKLYNVDGAYKERENNEDKNNKGDGFSDVVKIFTKQTSASDLKCGFSQIETYKKSPYFEARGFQRNTLKHFEVEDCSDNSSPMRHRSIIPIKFHESQVGYIARSTKAWLQPKYLFSEGFKKKRFLYNHDNAINVAKTKSCLFLVEGQGDVWRLWEAGVNNAAGLFGKDVSSEQRSILVRSGITTLVVLTDNDQAGRESKIKIKRDMGRLFNLVFPDMKQNDLGDMSVERIQANILQNLKGYY